jgi:transposase
MDIDRPPNGWGITVELWKQTPPEMRTIVLAMAQRIKEQDGIIRQQAKRIDQLETRIAELELKVNTNSTNSSKPPSSDPPNVQRKKMSPSQRKRGGQPGHPGTHRALIENPDKILDHLAKTCEECGIIFEGHSFDLDPIRYQVSEIPEPRVIVTEHRFHRRKCSCGHTTTPTIPEDIAGSAFGPRLETTVALLAGQFRISHREVKCFLAQQNHVNLSLGSIPAILRRVSAALESSTEEAWEEVRQAKVRYVDETGWKEHGQKAWLWAALSSGATAFRLAPTRGSIVLEECFGKALKRGIYVSDRCRSYQVIKMKKRGICHAHLKRDFVKMTEMGSSFGKKIGEQALEIQQKVFALWNRFDEKEITRKQLKNRIVRHERALRKTLEQGRDHSRSPKKMRGMCRDILEHWPAVWTFIDRSGVEPTNNSAERALRKPVLWRKGSFGTQSHEGSRFVERILTVTQTCIKQGLHVAQFVEQSVRSFRLGLTQPKIIQSL